MADLHASEYRRLDPDLPSIAALAAAEVDGLLNHRASSVSNLKRLSQLLATSFATQADSYSVRRFLDPIGVSVVVSTLRESECARTDSYDKLAEASLRLANQMDHATDDGSEQFLTTLKRFCIALSKHALASNSTAHIPSSLSEYKR